MARYKVQGPDGKVHVFEGPDGASPSEVEAFAEQTFSGKAEASPEPTQAGGTPWRAGLKTLGDVAAGAVRGAGSIGATILGARDAAEQGVAKLMGAKGYVAGNPNRREEMTNALQTMGADPNSGYFTAGKIGGELAGTAGVGPLLGGLTKGAPVISNALSSYGATGPIAARIAGGAVSGGAASGLADPESAGAGALIGGGLPVVGAPISGAVKGAANKLSGVTDLFMPGGAERILNRYTTKKVGEQNMPAVLDAARNAQEIIPGGKPTLGEVVAALPEGSPLLALEKITGKTAGGPSAAFGARKLEQADAVKLAEAVRNDASRTNYGKAFDPALHQLKPDAELLAIAKNPYFEAAMPTVDKLAQAKGLTPQDNLTEMLHYVKVGLDKKLKGGFGEVALDNAEKATILDLKNQLVGWLAKNNSDYEIGRAAHAQASKAIDSYVARQELAKNPLQATNLQGGLNIGEETRTHLPNMLSRPMMAVNAIGKMLGRNIETQIDAAAALRHLNPEEFAKALSKVPAAQRPAINALWQASRGPAITGAALATNQ